MKKIQNDHEALLTTVQKTYEADNIAALLSMEDIPILKKHRGTGGYLDIYMGTSMYGIDIYVPSECLDKAKEILDAPPIFDTDNKDTIIEEIDPVEAYSYTKKSRRKIWFILIFLVPGFFWIALYLIFNLF